MKYGAESLSGPLHPEKTKVRGSPVSSVAYPIAKIASIFSHIFLNFTYLVPPRGLGQRE